MAISIANDDRNPEKCSLFKNLFGHHFSIFKYEGDSFKFLIKDVSKRKGHNDEDKKKKQKEDTEGEEEGDKAKSRGSNENSLNQSDTFENDREDIENDRNEIEEFEKDLQINIDDESNVEQGVQVRGQSSSSLTNRKQSTTSNIPLRRGNQIQVPQHSISDTIPCFTSYITDSSPSGHLHNWKKKSWIFNSFTNLIK